MVVPNYYHKFKCIASECKHSCCIGWEIDVDAERAEEYRAVSGEMGERLRVCIAWETPPHFILADGERCPFLNSENLCDLILNLGEKSLCEICREHPRFYNVLPDRVEAGLGLCCEAAGELVLGQTEPVYLCDARESADELISFRDTLITLAQDRRFTIKERMEQILNVCGGEPPIFAEFSSLLRDLERLDPAWDAALGLLEKDADFPAFDVWMRERVAEYEQFLVYLLYRHVASAFDLADAKSRARFAVMGCEALYRMGAALWTEERTFSFADQVELVRMFSSELEYSEENLERIFDLLY